MRWSGPSPYSCACAIAVSSTRPGSTAECRVARSAAVQAGPRPRARPNGGTDSAPTVAGCRVERHPGRRSDYGPWLPGAVAAGTSRTSALPCCGCSLPPGLSEYVATNTALMFAAPAWASSIGMEIWPVQPAVDVCGCPCVSWPRMYATLTRAHSTGWSSVTVTVKLTVSPKLNGGVVLTTWSRTVGAWLPTVTRTCQDAERPVWSVTR